MLYTCSLILALMHLQIRAAQSLKCIVWCGVVCTYLCIYGYKSMQIQVWITLNSTGYLCALFIVDYLLFIIIIMSMFKIGPRMFSIELDASYDISSPWNHAAMTSLWPQKAVKRKTNRLCALSPRTWKNNSFYTLHIKFKKWVSIFCCGL
jgi:hypothetical protein